MARTKINSLDIEDLSISAEDIADGSITDDKILSVDSSKLTGTIAVEGLPEITDSNIGTASITGNSILSVDVSKLIGVIDGARLSSPLPILDGTALTNVQASIIPDNFITIEKLNTPNSGTQGQLLSIDSSALTFSNSPISLEEQSVTQNKFSSTGTFPAWDGSNLINVPPAGPNVSNEAVGGDFNGTVGSMSINNDVITDAKITELDASKITGTLPASINDAALESVGEIGFLNKTAWADNELVSITLDNSALSIGKVVTKVYEETALTVQPGLTNTNWDLTDNEEGFQTFSFLADDTTVRPSLLAFIGKDRPFTFANYYNGFAAGSNSDGIGYRIINKNGTGKAVITASDGLNATCDILENFPNTDILPAGTFTLEQGVFENNSWTIGKYPYRKLKGMWNERTDQSSAASSQAGLVITDPERHKVAVVDETRALLGYVRDFGSKFGVRMMKVVDRPDGTQITEQVAPASASSPHSYPLLHSSDGFKNNGQSYGDISVCHMTSTDKALFAGARSDGNSFGFYIHILNLPQTNSSVQEITMPAPETFFPTPGIVDNIEIKRLSDNHFIVITREERTFSPSGNGKCPVAYMGFVDWTTNTTTISENGTGQLLMTDQLSAYDDIIGFNHPMSHIFGTDTNNNGTEFIPSDECGLGYFFNNGNKPQAFYCRITNFSSSSNTPPSFGTIGSILTTLTTNQGDFINSSGVDVNTYGGRLDDGETHGTCSHTISRIDQIRALWVWGDADEGVEAAIVSLAPDHPSLGTSTSITQLDFNTTSHPMFVGKYPSKESHNIFSSATLSRAGQKQVAATVFKGKPGFFDPDTALCFFRYGDPGSSGVKVATFKFHSGSTTNPTFRTSIAQDLPGGEAPFTNLPDMSSQINDDSSKYWPLRAIALDDNRAITTEWYDAGVKEIAARLWHKESEIYNTQEWQAIISSTDSVDTTNISKINSMTVTGNDYTNIRPDYTAFCFSTDITQDVDGNITGGTYFIRKASEGTYRNIITNRNSVHGFTEGSWASNTESVYNGELWILLNPGTSHTAPPSGQPSSEGQQQWNNPVAAFRKAVSTPSGGTNRMDMGDVNAMSTNDFFTLGDKLSVGIAVFSDSQTRAPAIDKIIINYDGGGTVDVDKTHEYTIDIVNLDTIEVTAPSSGGPRNSKVYITT